VESKGQFCVVVVGSVWKIRKILCGRCWLSGECKVQFCVVVVWLSGEGKGKLCVVVVSLVGKVRNNSVWWLLAQCAR
jgi:hypothetical protein